MVRKFFTLENATEPAMTAGNPQPALPTLQSVGITWNPETETLTFEFCGEETNVDEAARILGEFYGAPLNWFQHLIGWSRMKEIKE